MVAAFLSLKKIETIEKAEKERDCEFFAHSIRHLRSLVCLSLSLSTNVPASKLLAISLSAFYCHFIAPISSLFYVLLPLVPVACLWRATSSAFGFRSSLLLMNMKRLPVF